MRGALGNVDVTSCYHTLIALNDDCFANNPS